MQKNSRAVLVEQMQDQKSEQEVVTDALFPTLSVFNTSDWTHLATFDRGVLYSVFKDCQEDSGEHVLQCRSGRSAIRPGVHLAFLQTARPIPACTMTQLMWRELCIRDGTGQPFNNFALLGSQEHVEDQQARIGSRSSFLASVVGNVWRHFTENEIKTHCLDAIRMAQPNNVATELSKAAIEDPLLHGAHQDELLAA
eukprot:scaffold214973_cov19-Tisochrysis_lutea.AAC.1